MAGGPYRTVAELEADLRGARARLANGERELTTITTRMDAFAARYQFTVGDRFDALRSVQTQRPPRLPGHADVERLYRELARTVHPDLAHDPSERTLRTRIMAELNDARDALDIERARELRTAWERGSDVAEPAAGVDRSEYLRIAIERAEARLTAVTADITRVQHSRLHLLMTAVETQERAGIDILGETAADVDREIQAARQPAIPATRPPSMPVVADDRALDAAPPMRRSATWLAPWLAALVSVASLAVLISVLRAEPTAAPISVTAAPVLPGTALRTDPQVTPAPLPYRVMERVNSLTGRTTLSVRIVIDATPTLAEAASTLADAARREIGAQQAVVIFAYRSAGEIGGPFTVGRAYLSVDGRGWSGDGMTEDGPDRGGVVGSVVVSIAGTIATQPFSASR